MSVLAIEAHIEKEPLARRITRMNANKKTLNVESLAQVQGEHGIGDDSGEGRVKFQRRMEQRRSEWEAPGGDADDSGLDWEAVGERQRQSLSHLLSTTNANGLHHKSLPVRWGSTHCRL